MFDKNEINVLLAALNSLQIKGSDAAYIYSIQITILIKLPIKTIVLLRLIPPTHKRALMSIFPNV